LGKKKILLWRWNGPDRGRGRKKGNLANEMGKIGEVGPALVLGGPRGAKMRFLCRSQGNKIKKKPSPCWDQVF